MSWISDLILGFPRTLSHSSITKNLHLVLIEVLFQSWSVFGGLDHKGALELQWWCGVPYPCSWIQPHFLLEALLQSNIHISIQVSWSTCPVSWNLCRFDGLVLECGKWLLSDECHNLHLQREFAPDWGLRWQRLQFFPYLTLLGKGCPVRQVLEGWPRLELHLGVRIRILWWRAWVRPSGRDRSNRWDWLLVPSCWEGPWVSPIRENCRSQRGWFSPWCLLSFKKWIIDQW